jgi:hypothetical protein
MNILVRESNIRNGSSVILLWGGENNNERWLKFYGFYRRIIW